MHEMSLAQGIVQLVEDAARREGFARVSVLRLEAGALSGVEVESLRFALSTMATAPYLENVQIDIETPAASAWCLQCSSSIQIQKRGEPCPQCGSYQIQPTGGTELRIIDLVVQDN